MLRGSSPKCLVKLRHRCLGTVSGNPCHCACVLAKPLLEASSADTIFKKNIAKKRPQKILPKIWAEPQFGCRGKHYRLMLMIMTVATVMEMTPTHVHGAVRRKRITPQPVVNTNKCRGEVVTIHSYENGSPIPSEGVLLITYVRPLILIGVP